MKTKMLCALLSGAFLCASASAAPTGSVVGTWQARGNQTTGALVFTSQSAIGVCRAVAGTLFGDPVAGFYCPSTGRLVFARKTAATNDTTQVYEANLSVDSAVDFMSGSFSVISPSGGEFGEFNFSATR